jgi:hypothetical protein
MSAVLPHYKQGPANLQVSTLIFGGQLVENTTQTPGTTDLTVKPSVGGTTTAGALNVLGVAGDDGNVLATQTGAANTYGQPQIDISVLQDYVPVYFGGVDIWVWYGGQAQPGELLVVGAATGANCNGCVMGITQTPKNASATITGAYNNVIGRCIAPGGVASAQLTQQIGGTGASVYYLGRARIF